MNIKPRLLSDHPLVQAAFAGIYKSSAKIFFRINPDGSHQQIPVFRALDSVNITHENKTELIHSFLFPTLPYSSERMRMKAALATDADNDEDDIPDDEADAHPLSGKKNQQYSLVRQNNNMYGCFDGREGEVIAMFRTKVEAEAFIDEQLHGGWTFKPFYGNKIGG
jgi:hypothetical protein